jgi:hypothetical protein
MRRVILVVLLSFCSIPSFSQSGMYGANVGLGYTTSYRSHITGTIEGYHLWRLTQHIYAGGSLSVQRYSFVDEIKPDASTINYGDLISIRQYCSYLFFSPKIDFGIGYRNRVHITLAAGAGVLLSGRQWYNEYVPFVATPSGSYGADTSVVNTSYNIPSVIYRAGVGVSERIPTHGFFNILLSQELSIIPNNLSHHGPALNTSYISFTVGFTHKYPQVYSKYY